MDECKPLPAVLRVDQPDRRLAPRELRELALSGGIVEADHGVVRVDELPVSVHAQQPAVADHRAGAVVQRVQDVLKLGPHTTSFVLTARSQCTRTHGATECALTVRSQCIRTHGASHRVLTIRSQCMNTRPYTLAASSSMA